MSSGNRIVLIDDDRVVGEIVSALASAMGLQCDITRTPEDFFDRIGPDTDLILLDLVMPEMDGIEILRLLGERQCKARIAARPRGGESQFRPSPALQDRAGSGLYRARFGQKSLPACG